MKLFSTKVHGVLDYATVALLPALPRVLGWDKNAILLFDTAALGVLAYSLATDYELGAVPVLSMPAHFRADQAFAATMAGGAVTLKDSPTAARVFCAGMAAFGLFASLATDEKPRSQR